MKNKLYHILSTGGILIRLGVASAFAQSTVSVFATGFNNPRGLKFGPDGFLYVAEGGAAGDLSTVGVCEQAAGYATNFGIRDFFSRISSSRN